MLSERVTHKLPVILFVVTVGLFGLVKLVAYMESTVVVEELSTEASKVLAPLAAEDATPAVGGKKAASASKVSGWTEYTSGGKSGATASPSRPSFVRQIPLERRLMPVFVTVIMLGASVYVILSKRYPDETSKWAYGCAGTCIGFWLH